MLIRDAVNALSVFVANLLGLRIKWPLVYIFISMIA